MTLLLQLVANGLVKGAMFALLAVAFGLVYRATRVFHIAFGGLFVLSAYALLVGTSNLGMPIYVAVPTALGVSASLGWLCEAGFYRLFHRKGCSSGVVLVASLGLLIVVENLVAMGFGNEARPINRSVAEVMSFGTVRLTSIQIMQLGICLAALVVTGAALKCVRALKAIWAMGDEPELLQMLGNPLYRYRAIVFALSALLAALPACLIGIDTGMNPHMGMHYLLIGAVAVLIGGTERFYGWVAGGFLLALLHSLVVWKLSSQWLDLVTFTILILLLLFRPQGILGIRRRLEEAI